MSDTPMTASALAFLREEAAHYKNLIHAFEPNPCDPEQWAHLVKLKAAADAIEQLERENNQLRAYVSALEEQMDSHGLQAAQRAAGMAKAQPEVST